MSRQALLACAALSVLAATWSAPASGLVVRVGVPDVEFRWSGASGGPTQYAVWISRDLAPFAPFALVDETRVLVPTAPGERVAIYVQAVRPHPLGGYQIGPPSPISETVAVLGVPQYSQAEGSFLLRCEACEQVELRPADDASLIDAELGLGREWIFVARADLSDGSSWLVWKSQARLELMFTSVDDPASVWFGPVATPFIPFVDTVDSGPGGSDEFLFVNPTHGNLLERFALGADDSLYSVASHPGYAGAQLGPLADYTGDGREDLLWIDAAGGWVAVWSFTDFDAATGQWQFSDSFLLMLRPAPGYRLVDAADYDGDSYADLLWRGPGGDLWIHYLVDGEIDALVQLPPLAGDDQLEVVGSPDLDGAPGAEIALRDQNTGRIWLAYPAFESFPAREAVLDAGADWSAVYVGP